MEDQVRIAAKVEHARKVEQVLSWLGWIVAVLGVAGVVTFSVLWVGGGLNAKQAIGAILGTALAAILSGAATYGSGVNVGLGAERLELAAKGADPATAEIRSAGDRAIGPRIQDFRPCFYNA